MPRPPLKRRRPNGGIFNSRGANDANRNAKVDLQHELANKPIGQRPLDSDDSDKLVTKGSGSQRGRNIPRREIYASGGVGKGDGPGSHPSRMQTRGSITRKRGEMSSPIQSQRTTASPQQFQAIETTTDRSHLSAKTYGGLLSRSQSTPMREHSILSDLKPRRRQPSILQNVDNDDSTLKFGDEEEFLPDNESTPLHLNTGSMANLASNALSTQFISRKVRSPVTEKPSVTPEQQRRLQSVSQSEAKQRPAQSLSPGPQLPPMPISDPPNSKQKRKTDRLEEDDIMAPPASSSSPAPSVEKNEPQARISKKSKEVPVGMSTEQLKALMPSKRRNTTRQGRRIINDFDIPEDSDDLNHRSKPVSSGDEDHSAFLPRQRRRAVRKVEPSSAQVHKLGGRSKATGREKKVNSIKKDISSIRSPAISSQILQSTSLTQTTPIIAPLSISRSRINRSTKSPSQQNRQQRPNPAKDNSVPLKPTSPENPKPRNDQPHGGSRRRLRSSTINGATNIAKGAFVNTQEQNQEIQDRPFTSNKENVQTLHDDDNIQDALQDNQVVMFNDSEEDVYLERKPVKEINPNFGNKWAEIDAWDMDYEDVEVMTPSSSSPMRRR